MDIYHLFIIIFVNTFVQLLHFAQLISLTRYDLTTELEHISIANISTTATLWTSFICNQQHGLHCWLNDVNHCIYKCLTAEISTFHDGTLQGGCSSTSWCMNILIIRNNSILCIQITSLRAGVQNQGFIVQKVDICNQFFAIFLHYNKIWYKPNENVVPARISIFMMNHMNHTFSCYLVFITLKASSYTDAKWW